MNMEKVRKASDRETARQYAINWQHWISKQNLSFGELAEWQAIFTQLAKVYRLEEEYKENGII